MYEPLLFSKELFAKLPKAHQDIIMAVGAEQEKFAQDAARNDDKLVAEVYAKAGAKVYDIDGPTLAKWQAIAKATAWKDYAEKNETTKALITAAQKLL
jgi:TRAP-type C4-dicarboxylate transport system substrate-binding protein